MPPDPSIKIQTRILSIRQQDAVIRSAKELLDKLRLPANRSLKSRIWASYDESNVNEISIELEPLSRFGGEHGKTGNTVVACQLSDFQEKSNHSLPLILKISPEKDNRVDVISHEQKNIDIIVKEVEKKRKNLENEWNAAKNLKNVFVDNTYFALPVHKSGSIENDDPIVLWAPFKSAISTWRFKTGSDDEGIIARIQDAYSWLSWTYPQNLQVERRDKLNSIINIFENLDAAFHYGGKKLHNEVSIVDHYSWELRDFDSLVNGESIEGISRYWLDLWDNPEKSVKISDFNSPWPNPFYILNCLNDYTKENKLKIRVGAVHGDIHPKNIVYTHDGRPNLIDYGWARPYDEDGQLQHISKDFVLMEANLRYMTLPPCLPYADTKSFCEWIGEISPPNIYGEIGYRIELIQKIRGIARNYLGKKSNWLYEYIIPLFLVSLGLLKYCHEAECTWAHRRQVLELSKYIAFEMGFKY